MTKKCSAVLCALLFPMLLLLACTGESPFKPENATVNLTLQNSGGHSDPSTITDTVGNRVRINLIGYLPSYIDSVKVVIGISTTTDTDFTFPKTTSWTDSQWIEIVFHSPGTRTVTATVFVEGKAKPVTATIVVVGRLVNHAPALDVSGVRNITTTQACSLSLSTRDIDSGQTFTYAMIKAPQNATLAANIFKWTPPTGHTGTDTVKFTVTDNGKPPMSDTQTVFITVSLQITVPVKVQGVKAASKINGYFVFSWSKVSNADSYDVFRSADMVNFQKIGSSSDSLFGDSVKTANFYYYVVAVNSAGPSPASAMVYSGSIKTPPVIMVPTLDTSVFQGKTLAFMVQYVASAQDTVTLGATDISGGKLPDSATFDQKTGLFTWTPTFSELGLYKIVFTATNGNAVAKDTVKITVNKTDRAPVVQTQSVNTGRDAAITITLIANDPDNDAITQWRLPTAARHGTASLANPAIGSVVYTPNAGFIGVDTFAVDAYDGTLWSLTPANVIVTIDSSKIAPKIQTQPRPDTTVNQGATVAFTVAINNAFPTPTFTWYKGTKGSGASVQSGTNPSYQKTGVAAADSGNYYVIVANASGSDTSAYAHLMVLVPPSAPTLSSPANNATGVAVNPTLTWNAVTGAAAYRVQVSTTSDFSTGIVADDSTLTAASKALSGLTNNTVYYWRANARNAGGTSAWSTAFTFTTVVAVSGVPVNANPANSATGVAVNPTLTWSAVTGAITYRVQVSTASDFSTGIIVDDSTLTNASKALSGLTNSTLYYWRVNAKNAVGASAWSTPSSFTTIVAAPSAPILSTPANSATGVAVNPTLTWNAVTGAAAYRVQVSTASDFSTGIIVDDSTLTAGSKALGALTNGTKYYWHVNAKNAGGASAWASANFTTIVKFALSITATNGTVTPSPAGSPYDSGTGVSLAATPVTGYSFTGWSGDLAGSANPATITMNSAKSVIASFTITKYLLTVKAGTGGRISAPLTDTSTVNYGAATTITAVPNPGYKFVNWSVTGGTPTIANTTLASTTVQLTSGNASVKANFSPLCQWTEVTTESPGNQVRAFATTGNNIFAGTYIKGVFLSTNNGTTWTPVDSGFTDSYDSIIQCLAISGSKIYAGTSGGYVWVADNSGINTTWTLPENNGLTSANVISLGVNGPTLFAGVRGYVAGVLESVDGAKNWSNNGSLGYNVSCYAVNGYNTFAGTFGYGVYMSPDNGASWNAVNNGLENLNVLSLARSSVYILAGTSGGGIYISSNNGTLWTASDSGLPANAVVQSLAVSGTNLLAGTMGNGVYLSMDYGTSWIPANAGLTNTNVWSLGVSGGNIVAGTENGGIFVSPVP